MRQKIENLFAIPTVVATSDYFRARGEDLFRQPRRNAEPRSGVLPVRDAQVDAALRDDVRQAIVDNLSARRPDNVANE
jgi:hypothetical protein